MRFFLFVCLAMITGTAFGQNCRNGRCGLSSRTEAYTVNSPAHVSVPAEQVVTESGVVVAGSQEPTRGSSSCCGRSSRRGSCASGACGNRRRGYAGRRCCR